MGGFFIKKISFSTCQYFVHLSLSMIILLAFFIFKDVFSTDALNTLIDEALWIKLFEYIMYSLIYKF